MCSLILTLTLSLISNPGSSVPLTKEFSHEYSYTRNHITELTNLIHDNQSVISSSASITVFTHGMGGTGRDWYTIDETILNDDQFGGWPDNNPILVNPTTILLRNESLFNRSSNSNIFVDQLYSGNEPECVDASKPLFVVYQGPVDCREDNVSYYVSNEELYLNFADAVDAFIFEYYTLFGVVPKINLIGHSRGGLINMIYAIHHPQIIASFMSVGTPYLGSDWAKVLWCLDEAVIASNPSMSGPSRYSGVVGDTFKNTYADTWNDVVATYGFPTRAVGCEYSSALITDAIPTIINAVLDAWAATLAATPLAGFASLASSALQSLIDTIYSVIIYQTASLTEFILDGALDTIAFGNWLKGLFNPDPLDGYLMEMFAQIVYVLKKDVFEPIKYGNPISTDICVNYNSQIGMDRDGTSVFDFDSHDSQNLVFDLGDLDGAELTRPGSPSILHNYETKHSFVRDVFSSFFQSHPECRHAHVFNGHNSSAGHTFSCSCRAVFHSCQGSNSYLQHSSSEHIQKCLLCGYERLMTHEFSSPVYYSSSKHKQTCAQCGQEKLTSHSCSSYDSFNGNGHNGSCACGALVYGEQHSFIYSGTLNSHVGMCPCGHSVLEPHTYIGGKCIKCNRRKPGFGL